MGEDRNTENGTEMRLCCPETEAGEAVESVADTEAAAALVPALGPEVPPPPEGPPRRAGPNREETKFVRLPAPVSNHMHR